jgi:cell division protein FtsB
MPAMEFDQPEVQAGPPPEVRARSRRRLRSPEETRARNRRILAYGLFIFSLILMVNALVGENGYLATLRARREHDALMQALSKLQQDNNRLADEANRLKNDPAALEEAARRDLGLMRPGETLVVVRDRQPDR